MNKNKDRMSSSRNIKRLINNWASKETKEKNWLNNKQSPTLRNLINIKSRNNKEKRYKRKISYKEKEEKYNDLIIKIT